MNTTTTTQKTMLELLGLEAVPLKEVAEGEYIRRAIEASETYTRGEYDRSEKRYALYAESDISKVLYLKGSTIVIVGFTY